MALDRLSALSSHSGGFGWARLDSRSAVWFFRGKLCVHRSLASMTEDTQEIHASRTTSRSKVIGT